MDCNCGPLTKDDYLELWRGVLPSSYTDPIEQSGDGRGFDIPSLQGAIFAHFAENMEVTQQAYFLRRYSGASRAHAGGARKAQGFLSITRAAPTVGGITITAGTIVIATAIDSFGDELQVGRYLVTADTVLSEGNGTAVPLPVVAEYAGYAGNVPAGFSFAFDERGRKSVPSVITSVSKVTELPNPQQAADSFDASMVGRYVRFVGTIGSLNGSMPRKITSFIAGTENSIDFSPPLNDAGDIGTNVVIEVEEYEDFGISIEQPTALEGGVSASLDAIGVDRGRGRIDTETDEEYREYLANLPDTVSPAAINRILESILLPCGIPFDLAETRDIEGLMGCTWDVHPFDFGQLAPLDKLTGSEYVGQGGVYLNESSFTRFFVISVGCAVIDSTPEVGLPCINRAWHAVNDKRAAGVGFLIIKDCSL